MNGKLWNTHAWQMLYHPLHHRQCYLLSSCYLPFICWALPALAHFSSQRFVKGTVVPMGQPEKQRLGEWACQGESQALLSDSRAGVSGHFAYCLLSYKLLRFQYCFHFLRGKLKNLHSWFRPMTESSSISFLLHFFPKHSFWSRETKKFSSVYKSPALILDIGWRVSSLHSPGSRSPMNNSQCEHVHIREDWAGPPLQWLLTASRWNGLFSQLPWAGRARYGAHQLVQHCPRLATTLHYSQDGSENFTRGHQDCF